MKNIDVDKIIAKAVDSAPTLAFIFKGALSGVLRELADKVLQEGLKDSVDRIDQLERDLALLNKNINSPDGLIGCDLYKHHSGDVYQLICISNATAVQDGYIKTAVYKKVLSGEIFSRPYVEFVDKFKPFGLPVEPADSDKG